MDIVFEVMDKNGKRIRLTTTQWSHIKTRHPGVNESEIHETLKNPLKIIEEDNNVIILYKYYKERKEPEKYLKLMVKYLNGDGYVITSYFVRNML